MEALSERLLHRKPGARAEHYADIVLQLAEKTGPQIDEMGFRQLYEEIDLPLVPVLALRLPAQTLDVLAATGLVLATAALARRGTITMVMEERADTKPFAHVLYRPVALFAMRVRS